MSAMRASGANRTSARGGAAAAKSRATGSFVLNDAVWYEAVWFFTSTAPITPACNSSASAPRLADQASVRGESFVDAAGIARIQGAGRMPWQQHFYSTGLLLQYFFAHCHYGQPRSMPAA